MSSFNRTQDYNCCIHSFSKVKGFWSAPFLTRRSDPLLTKRSDPLLSSQGYHICSFPHKVIWFSPHNIWSSSLLTRRSDPFNSLQGCIWFSPLLTFKKKLLFASPLTQCYKVLVCRKLEINFFKLLQNRSGNNRFKKYMLPVVI